GVQLGELQGEGEYLFEILPGTVAVLVSVERGMLVASLTSVEPRHERFGLARLLEYMQVLGWDKNERDESIPVASADAGAWHRAIAAASLDRLNLPSYDLQQLESLMLEDDLTTIQLIWRESDRVIHARDPFPVGGVVEDPATGAAAAALGGYLR